MLNSTEHVISTAHKSYNAEKLQNISKNFFHPLFQEKSHLRHNSGAVAPINQHTKHFLSRYTAGFISDNNHAREPLYSNSAVIAWWSQSTGGKIGVFMCTLLLKNVINFLIFYF